MAKWEKTQVSEFLTERVGRHKPTAPVVANLKRLDKIDFSGKMHFSTKSSKTDMIIAKKGDLVISGINVAKGALAVYDGEDDITATIHYSSYQFDNKKIDVEYFKRFLKSPKFIQLLKDQVKGGIKTEIKPKHLLPLKIELPDLDTQKSIVSFFERTENKIEDINTQISYQLFLVNKLRQAVLQEAVQGKLTAEWRKRHPELISGENHAARLLEKIKAEKALRQTQGAKRTKRMKELPPITDAEKPFDLPEGWIYLYLNDISLKVQDGTHYSPQKQYKLKKENTFLYITSKNIKDDGIETQNATFIDAQVHKKIYERCNPEFGDVLIIKDGAVTGRITLNNLKEEFSILSSVAFIKTDNKNIDNLFLMYYLRSPMGQEQIVGRMTGAAITRIILRRLQRTVVPFPSLAEQQAIVKKVEQLMDKIDALEEQIKARKEQAEQLMQVVLKEAFNGEA